MPRAIARSCAQRVLSAELDVLDEEGLLGLILPREVWPMATLIKWWIQLGRGNEPDLRAAPSFAVISHGQAALVVAMVFVATAITRGF